MHPRLLFILRRRNATWGCDPSYSTSHSSGLANSVRFITDMLASHGVQAASEEATDNNCIDRLITEHRPTHVIIEAFWVVPEKFDVLKRLHPRVTFIVRNHSEMPFLANEGSAIGWAVEYLRRGVQVMCNSPRAQAELQVVARAHGLPCALVTYGPNVYPEEAARHLTRHVDRDRKHIDIGCFGAMRPLKNHLQQAIAAIGMGETVNKPVRFHVNATRVEGGADPILKNLRSLFAGAHGHELVEHGWKEHDAFLRTMRKMDLSLQVSLSETFNIVSADAVSQGIPVVVSNDVPWIGDYAKVDPNDAGAITNLLVHIWGEAAATAHVRLHRQRRDLIAYCNEAESAWLALFRPSHRMHRHG